MDAITGKSNFDISEWILIKLLEQLRGRHGTVAMLCKTAVARKVLTHAWRNRFDVANAAVHEIDAFSFFGAAVDACLLTCVIGVSARHHDCRIYDRLEDEKPARVIGYHEGRLIADVNAYKRWKHLEGEEVYKWRSGIKHDCSKVMELRKEGGRYCNGLGELVELEIDYLYPMLKNSELANGHTREPVRWMLVPQKTVGDETSVIKVRAPRTWEYLQRHREALDRRASAIYRNRPMFSIFGVGEYSFSSWKVAISGFYKKLQFTPVGSFSGKPIVLDDTAYFIPCSSEEEAVYVASLLNSDTAREFFRAFVFWDTKRPITIELLRRLDLLALAQEMDSKTALVQLLETKTVENQISLFA